MKTLNDLRQCDVFDNSTLRNLQKLCPVNLNVVISENSFCVVVTQDCDIVHDETEEEPFVEFIIGNTTEDKSYKNGKNPRKLHLVNNEQTIEFIVHNRFFVKKELLLGFKFSDGLFDLNSDNKKILKKWLGNRYTRAAFPDEFNNRLRKSKISKLVDKGFSSKVSHIFFEVEDVELSPDESYELNVLIVLDFDSMYRENPDLDEDKTKDEYEKKFTEAFKTDGIELFLQCLSEDDVTLTDLKKYKRWNMDSISYSKQNQSSPVEEIDKIV